MYTDPLALSCQLFNLFVTEAVAPTACHWQRIYGGRWADGLLLLIPILRQYVLNQSINQSISFFIRRLWQTQRRYMSKIV